MNKDCSSNPHCSTNLQNFVEYPIRLLKFVFKKLKIRELFKRHVKDPRSRVDDYELDSLLMLALDTHLFRSPSKNNFHLNLRRRDSVCSMAKFTGFLTDRCPAIRTIDNVLLELESQDFSPILPSIFRNLIRQRVFQLHPEFIPQGEFDVAIDAEVSHTYHERSQHPCALCPYCLRRSRGDKVWYLHLDLVASFIAPNGFQMPLLLHRIRARPEWGKLSDSRWKQECERSAFPILLRELRRQFPRLKFCIHLDALYATDPVLNLLRELKMGFSIVRKTKVLKTVGEDCNGLKLFASPLQIDKESRRFNIHQTIHFFNRVAYRGHSLNIIQVDEYSEKKESKRFAKIQSIKTHWEWIVHQRLTKENVATIADHSRIRWKQEDSFNTLQNRGFSIKHDFNRTPKAQMIRTYLILIAYAISSVIRYSQLGRYILSKGYTMSFIMTKMLQDLVYLTENQLFSGYSPSQLRFSRGPP
jgi:hypothetical protein